ncbi:MAG TPA: metalloregulator ArsR/SmtB family transcription factor [Rhizomicrobium sp.]|jgi:DNA-binding transcriptional ArsR family regulator
MKAFSALADPVRASIVSMLAANDMNASEIASHFPVSRPAVSRHLSVLLRANLVQVREEAQRRVYSLDPKGLDDANAWIEECRRVWNARLDALGRHLDAMAKRKKKVGG